MLFLGKGEKAKTPKKPTQTLNTSLYPVALYVDDCIFFWVHRKANTKDFIQEVFGEIF